MKGNQNQDLFLLVVIVEGLSRSRHGGNCFPSCGVFEQLCKFEYIIIRGGYRCNGFSCCATQCQTVATDGSNHQSSIVRYCQVSIVTVLLSTMPTQGRLTMNPFMEMQRGHLSVLKHIKPHNSDLMTLVQAGDADTL